ncbi:MAG: PAS domain-containing protein [Ferrovibrio sp.]
MSRAADTGGESEGRIAPKGEWPVFRDPRFLVVLRHWAAERQGTGVMMPRSALDPLAIKSCLPHIWLAQYVADIEDFMFRLAGEQVNEAWGINITGKRPRDFMAPASAAAAGSIYRRILFTPAIHVGYRRIEPTERQEKGAERLVVPLCDPEGRPWGIFGMSLYVFDPVTQADMPPYVGPDVTYYPCIDLPAGTP